MNNQDQYTLREIELSFGKNDAMRIAFANQWAKNHTDRFRQVERAIDLIISEYQKTRQHRHERSEDGLTIDFILSLRLMGFDASHDKDIGGHCDIAIENEGNFLWLGEAKIATGYDWLLKGFNQLVTRYSPGTPGQDAGGMLIYCKQQNVRLVMERWENHLRTNVANLSLTRCQANPLIILTEHEHPVSGLPYKVRHTPMALFFDPQDK